MIDYREWSRFRTIFAWRGSGFQLCKFDVFLVLVISMVATVLDHKMELEISLEGHKLLMLPISFLLVFRRLTSHTVFCLEIQNIIFPAFTQQHQLRALLGRPRFFLSILINSLRRSHSGVQRCRISWTVHGSFTRNCPLCEVRNGVSERDVCCDFPR